MSVSGPGRSMSVSKHPPVVNRRCPDSPPRSDLKGNARILPLQERLVSRRRPPIKRTISRTTVRHDSYRLLTLIDEAPSVSCLQFYFPSAGASKNLVASNSDDPSLCFLSLTESIFNVVCSNATTTFPVKRVASFSFEILSEEIVNFSPGLNIIRACPSYS